MTYNQTLNFVYVVYVYVCTCSLVVYQIDLYFLKHDFSPSLELTALSRLPDQQSLGIHSSPPHYC